MARPPRLAQGLLRRMLAGEDREFLLGDLDEEFADRAAGGRRAARGWYWRQVRHAALQRARRPAERRGTGAFLSYMAGTWRDGRYAWGSLRRSPGFVAMAAATLALGVGANAAIYALIDAVLLRSLPFEEAEELVILRNSFTDGRPGYWLVSFPDYEDYQAGSTDVLDHLAAWQQQLPAMSLDDGGRRSGSTLSMQPGTCCRRWESSPCSAAASRRRKTQSTRGSGSPCCRTRFGRRASGPTKESSAAPSSSTGCPTRSSACCRAASPVSSGASCCRRFRWTCGSPTDRPSRAREQICAA